MCSAKSCLRLDAKPLEQFCQGLLFQVDALIQVSDSVQLMSRDAQQPPTMTIYSICLHCGNLIGHKERRYCPHCDTEEKRQRQVDEQAEIEGARDA